MSGVDASARILDLLPQSESRAIEWAVVKQLSPLRVQFPGDTVTVEVPREKTYTPALEERAILLRVGSAWVAIGAIA